MNDREQSKEQKMWPFTFQLFAFACLCNIHYLFFLLNTYLICAIQYSCVYLLNILNPCMLCRPTPINADEQKPDFTRATSCPHKLLLKILQKGNTFEGPACFDVAQTVLFWLVDDYEVFHFSAEIVPALSQLKVQLVQSNEKQEQKVKRKTITDINWNLAIWAVLILWS